MNAPETWRLEMAKTASELAYERLRQAIIDGEFEPGKRLTELGIEMCIRDRTVRGTRLPVRSDPGLCEQQMNQPGQPGGARCSRSKSAKAVAIWERSPFVG